MASTQLKNKNPQNVLSSLYSKPLPVPPPKKILNLAPDNIMDPARQRLKYMMQEAADKATRALSLEKESKWEEALIAYLEICAFFKKMMENADSKDLHDLLYVHRRYSQRISFIRNKVSELNLQTVSGADSKRNESIKANSGNSINSNQLSPPTLIDLPTKPNHRSYSESKVNAPNLNSIKQTRSPSLATLASTPTATSLLPAPNSRPVPLEPKVLKKSSLPSLSQSYRTQPSQVRQANKTHFGGVLSWDEGSPSNQYGKTFLNGPYRKSFDTGSGTALTNPDKLDSRRGVDLISIPESEESSGAESIITDSHLSPSTGFQPRPKLGHMPSMPNLSLASFANSKLQSISSQNSSPTLTDKDAFELYNSHPNLFESSRESCTLPSSFDSNDGFLYSSTNSSSSQFIFAAVQPRPSTPRKPSIDRIAIESSSPLSNKPTPLLIHQNNSISSLPDSPQFSFLHHNNSSSSLSNESTSPRMPGPSFMTRSKTSPDTPPLTIQINSNMTSKSDLFSPDTPSTPIPFPNTASSSKHNLSLAQSIWNEEMKSKKSYVSPPSIKSLRALWQISCLKDTMTKGGYLGSKKVYIDPIVWRQTGVRVPNVDLKMAELEILTEFMIRLKNHWKEDVFGIQQGLEELEGLAFNAQRNLSAKLNYIPSVKSNQKTATTALISFASKITKSVERIQASYSRDKIYDQGQYIDVMIRFFDACDFLEDWYTHFSSRMHQSKVSQLITLKLHRYLEFLSMVVVQLAMQDLTVYMGKYFKRVREMACI